MGRRELIPLGAVAAWRCRHLENALHVEVALLSVDQILVEPPLLPVVRVPREEVERARRHVLVRRARRWARSHQQMPPEPAAHRHALYLEERPLILNLLDVFGVVPYRPGLVVRRALVSRHAHVCRDTVRAAAAPAHCARIKLLAVVYTAFMTDVAVRGWPNFHRDDFTYGWVVLEQADLAHLPHDLRRRPGGIATRRQSPGGVVQAGAARERRARGATAIESRRLGEHVV